MPEETPAEKPKKKRGRPKGSKNKPKKPKAEEPKVAEPQFETKLGETKPEKPKKEEPKVEAKPKKPKVKAPKKEKPTPVSASGTALTLSEVAALEAEAKAAEASKSFSDRYRQDRIFRREMGEPEFWIGKKGLATLRPILTKDEEQEISRKVQIPTVQTPPYIPKHILSPEFGGTSNYERGIADVKQELEEKLQRLKANPDSNTQQIVQAEEDLKTLDYLYENYYSGMNVFRTAKGGRDKLRE